MAVVYFTSNASTGAGSLVEAVQNASPGDVVRPDETVFERGATIEIALAGTLTIDKNLTLDASPFRVRLNGGGAVRCVNTSNAASVVVTAFDFVGGVPVSGDGGGFITRGATTFNRCAFYGCRATYGGAIMARAFTTLNDCVVAGCAATGSGGGITALAGLALNGSTIVGNISTNTGYDVRLEGGDLTARNTITNGVRATGGGASEYSGSVVDVALSETGFVAPPPDVLSVDNWDANAWKSWDLHLFDDASPNPSTYRDAGDVNNMSRYDVQGNFRGRETNGAASCSPGAYETLQADLFWIGVDASGTAVTSPSFLSANGWAASRFATVSGDAAPQSEQAFFIGQTTVFDNSAPQNATLNVGGYATVSTGASSATHFYLTLGVGATFSLSAPAALLRFGAFAKLDWLSGDLTVKDDAALSVLAIPSGATLTIDGVKVESGTLRIGNSTSVVFLGDEAVLVATQNCSVEASVFTGTGYFATPPGTDLTAATIPETVRACDYGASVSSFNASRTSATSATLSWVKQNQTPSVLLEKANGRNWDVVDNKATGESFVASVGASATFRLFDGENFFTSSVSSYGTAYELAEEQTIGYLKTLISVGYLN